MRPDVLALPAPDAVAESRPAVLAVRGLTVEFRRDGAWQPAVRGIGFDLPAGQTLALVGESGSGKSVTALAIMRLVRAAEGRARGQVLLDGMDLLALPEQAMRRVRGDQVAMVFQEPMTSLNPVLPVGTQLVEALRCHRGMDGRSASAEAVRMLDRVRLPAAAARMADYPHRFSGGMRQRVMIAMALVCRPRILIADEPTTALDVTVQAQVLALLKSLQDEFGMAMLFITHDFGVVAEVADRVLVMRQGEAVEEASAAALFAAPRAPYTRALLAAVPRLGALRDMAGPQRFGADDAAPAAPSGQPLLQVRNLCTRFAVRGGIWRGVVARVHAVEDVSFDLAAGETLALVGESGCGKSTTGRSILRLVEPESGSVRFDGTEVRGLSGTGLRALRRDMQMIFQDPYASLNPRLEVGQAIAEPMLVHGIATRTDEGDRVAALLRQVGLSPDMATRLPHEFSGGQRQRVCIARALSLSPRLLIADEAVSALDVSVKAQVVDLMLDLQARLGLSFLFISHDMAIVERVSHRIAVMYLGEIVEIGPRAAVLNTPQHAYTRRLLEAVPIADPARRRVRGTAASVELPSPIRTGRYEPPRRVWREAGPGHLVQEPG